MDAEDDRERIPTTPEEIERLWTRERARQAMTKGDELRAVELAKAVEASDLERAYRLVYEVDTRSNTVADALVRTRNLLFAYLAMSWPHADIVTDLTRKRLIDEELAGMEDSDSDSD